MSKKALDNNPELPRPTEEELDYEFIIDSKHYTNIAKTHKTFSEMSNSERDTLKESQQKLEDDLIKINNYLNGCKIRNISSDMSCIEIAFINQVKGEEYIIKAENAVFFQFGNLDFNNIHKINISYTYSIAIDYSLRFKKDMLGLYFWDKHDKVMPKSFFIAERVKIGKFNFENYDRDLITYMDSLFCSR